MSTESNLITLTFKTGQSLTGTIISQALVIMIFKVGNYFYLVNKTALLDDGLNAEVPLPNVVIPAINKIDIEQMEGRMNRKENSNL